MNKKTPIEVGALYILHDASFLGTQRGLHSGQIFELTHDDGGNIPLFKNINNDKRYYFDIERMLMITYGQLFEND